MYGANDLTVIVSAENWNDLYKLDEIELAKAKKCLDVNVLSLNVNETKLNFNTSNYSLEKFWINTSQMWMI